VSIHDPFKLLSTSPVTLAGGAKPALPVPSLVCELDDEAEFAAQVASGDARPLAASCPDRGYPEVQWAQYGIVSTNEIIVVARCRELACFARAPWYLAYPEMRDHLLGGTPENISFGLWLADAVWERYFSNLATQAIFLRTARSVGAE
jgi:hypothetical protein